MSENRSNEFIRVYCRVRPLREKELNGWDSCQLSDIVRYKSMYSVQYPVY